MCPILQCHNFIVGDVLATRGKIYFIVYVVRVTNSFVEKMV